MFELFVQFYLEAIGKFKYFTLFMFQLWTDL